MKAEPLLSVPINVGEVLADESLAVFMAGMKEFDAAFCEAMLSGGDFTLNIEVRGNARKLLHCRVQKQNIRRPREAGANKKIA